MSNNKGKKSQVTNSTKTANEATKPMFFFKKENYILTIVSLAVIVIGFMLMSGSEGDIYDFRRTTLAPIVVMLGFAIGGFAIFYKSKSKA